MTDRRSVLKLAMGLAGGGLLRAHRRARPRRRPPGSRRPPPASRAAVRLRVAQGTGALARRAMHFSRRRRRCPRPWASWVTISTNRSDSAAITRSGPTPASRSGCSSSTSAAISPSPCTCTRWSTARRARSSTTPRMFDWDKSGVDPRSMKDHAGFAGFRVQFVTDWRDDVAAFLGRELFPRGRRRYAPVRALGARARGRHRLPAAGGVPALHLVLVRAARQGCRHPDPVRAARFAEHRRRAALSDHARAAPRS